MSASDGRDSGEDFHAEVSDLRPMAPATSQPLPFDPRRSRQRTVRWATGLAVVLLVLLVTITLPGVRDGALAIIVGPTPPPLPAATATRAPGDDLFYLLPNPPGVTVALDGKALGQLPLPGGGHPLRLSRGRHTLTWTPKLFALRPLKCQVSVPSAPGDSCPFVTQEFTPNVLANEQGHIIALHESVAALAASDAGALTAAIRVAVASVSSTGYVQPGETFYYFDNNTLSGEQVVAQQTLRATLNFQYVSSNQAGYPEPCILAQPAIPCRFAGQDCTQVCTVVQPPPAATLRPDQEWIGAVEVNASWTYTLLDGTADAQNVGDQFGMQLMAIRITRDAGGWHVSPIIGHTPGLDVADDPVCDPARYLLSQTSSWSFMVLNPPPYASNTFISGPTLADGCAVALNFGPPNTAAIFLQRFGVLSTANADARNPNDKLPVADAAEQQLAQQLLASAGG